MVTFRRVRLPQLLLAWTLLSALAFALALGEGSRKGEEQGSLSEEEGAGTRRGLWSDSSKGGKGQVLTVESGVGMGEGGVRGRSLWGDSSEAEMGQVLTEESGEGVGEGVVRGRSLTNKHSGCKGGYHANSAYKNSVGGAADAVQGGTPGRGLWETDKCPVYWWNKRFSNKRCNRCPPMSKHYKKGSGYGAYSSGSTGHKGGNSGSSGYKSERNGVQQNGNGFYGNRYGGYESRQVREVSGVVGGENVGSVSRQLRVVRGALGEEDVGTSVSGQVRDEGREVERRLWDAEYWKHHKEHHHEKHHHKKEHHRKEHHRKEHHKKEHHDKKEHHKKKEHHGGDNSHKKKQCPTRTMHGLIEETIHALKKMGYKLTAKFLKESGALWKLKQQGTFFAVPDHAYTKKRLPKTVYNALYSKKEKTRHRSRRVLMEYQLLKKYRTYRLFRKEASALYGTYLGKKYLVKSEWDYAKKRYLLAFSPVPRACFYRAHLVHKNIYCNSLVIIHGTSSLLIPPYYFPKACSNKPPSTKPPSTKPPSSKSPPKPNYPPPGGVLPGERPSPPPITPVYPPPPNGLPPSAIIPGEIVPSEAPDSPIVEPPGEGPSTPVVEPPTPGEGPSIPVVEPPGEGPSIPVTEPPGEGPSSPMTDPPSEAPASPMTDPPSEAPSSPMTDPPSEAPSSPIGDAPSPDEGGGGGVGEAPAPEEEEASLELLS